MKWAIPLVLALSVPVDSPPAKVAADTSDSAHERRREAIEQMNDGVEKFAGHDVSGAFAAMARAIEIDPNYATAHVNLARLHATVDHDEQAQTEFELALALIEAELAELADDPTALDVAWELQAETHYDLGLVHLARVRESFAKPEGAPQRNSVRLAANAFDQATRTRSVPSAPAGQRRDYQALHQRGVAHDLLDDVVEADRSYRACIDVQPDHTPCWTALVRLYYGFGEPQLAKAVLETGLGLDANDVELLLASAELELQLGHPQQAIDVGVKAKAVDASNVDVNFVLGMAYYELNMREQASDELGLYMQRQISQPASRVRAAEHALMWLLEP
jgi:tetratricopeptide (TPR) repeat protein